MKIRLIMCALAAPLFINGADAPRKDADAHQLARVCPGPQLDCIVSGAEALFRGTLDINEESGLVKFFSFNDPRSIAMLAVGPKQFLKEIRHLAKFINKTPHPEKDALDKAKAIVKQDGTVEDQAVLDWPAENKARLGVVRYSLLAIFARRHYNSKEFDAFKTRLLADHPGMPDEETKAELTWAENRAAILRQLRKGNFAQAAYHAKKAQPFGSPINEYVKGRFKNFADNNRRESCPVLRAALGIKAAEASACKKQEDTILIEVD